MKILQVTQSLIAIVIDLTPMAIGSGPLPPTPESASVPMVLFPSESDSLAIPGSEARSRYTTPRTPSSEIDTLQRPSFSGLPPPLHTSDDEESLAQKASDYDNPNTVVQRDLGLPCPQTGRQPIATIIGSFPPQERRPVSPVALAAALLSSDDEEYPKRESLSRGMFADQPRLPTDPCSLFHGRTGELTSDPLTDGSPPQAVLVLRPSRTISDPGSRTATQLGLFPSARAHFSDDAEFPNPIPEAPRLQPPVDPAVKVAALASFLQRSPSRDLRQLLNEVMEFANRIATETRGLQNAFLGPEADRLTAPGDFQSFTIAVKTIPTTWFTLFSQLKAAIPHTNPTNPALTHTNPSIKNVLLQLDATSKEFIDGLAQAVQFNSNWLDILNTGHAKQSVPFVDNQAKVIQSLTQAVEITVDRTGVYLRRQSVALQKIIASLL